MDVRRSQSPRPREVAAADTEAGPRLEPRGGEGGTEGLVWLQRPSEQVGGPFPGSEARKGRG